MFAAATLVKFPSDFPKRGFLIAVSWPPNDHYLHLCRVISCWLKEEGLLSGDWNAEQEQLNLCWTWSDSPVSSLLFPIFWSQIVSSSAFALTLYFTHQRFLSDQRCFEFYYLIRESKIMFQNLLQDFPKNS